MFEGQVDPANQIHDFNPGITESGLFWTIPVPNDAVTTPGGGVVARLHMEDLRVIDQHDIINALRGGPGVPALVSFDVRWVNPQGYERVEDPENDFAGEFVVTDATIEWTGETETFRFVSDPAETSAAPVAFVGHERNGVYYP